MARREGRFALSMPDRTTTALILAFITLLGAAFGPRYLPIAQRGIECSDLAQPIGGNHLSIGAQPNDPGALQLQLELAVDTITLGEGLPVRLRFVNNDNGSVILYLPDRGPVLRRLDTADTPIAGITFVISTVSDVPIPDQTAAPPVVTTFDLAELNVLGARGRCTERLTIDVSQLLQAAGYGAGQYRIQAFYANTSAGVTFISDPDEPPPSPTPYPGYEFTQGVWVGQASSEERLFTVLAPGG